MKYLSCRGLQQTYSFEEILLAGYAPDGGMFVPETIPKVTLDELNTWKGLPYVDIVKKVVPMFVTEEDMPRADVTKLLDEAFHGFHHPEVVPVRCLKDGLNILEMFHGETRAFKDLSMSCLARFLEYFLKKKQQHATVLVCTSGDTGSSAIAAVKELTAVDIVVLLPRNRISEIQELQMTTVCKKNVHVFRVDGTPDEADIPVKACFLDKDYAAKHRLISLNSVNWARVMVQIAHFFYAYLKTCDPEISSTVDIIIPTGGCGNVTAGTIAYLMGLPIQLTCAVNVNDVVHRVIQTGTFEMSKEVWPSIAPSMDVQNPYNFQRILYLLSDRNGYLVRDILTKFEDGESVELPKELHTKVKSILSSYSADDTRISDAIKACYNDNQYLVCPHTATAVACYYDNRKRYSGPCICMATASPAKFPEVMESLSLTVPSDPVIDRIYSLPTRYEDLEADSDWLQALKGTIEGITANRSLPSSI